MKLSKVITLLALAAHFPNVAIAQASHLSVTGLSAQLDGDKQSRNRAFAALAKAGPAGASALPKLYPFLKDPDLQTEADAAGCILSIEPEQNDATKTITRLLRNGNPDIRLAALQASGNAKSGALALLPEVIITLQGDISPFVRNKAVWAIGQLGSKGKEAIPTILDALKKTHPLEDFHGGRDLKSMDETIYKSCVATLGEIGYGSSSACSALAAILTDTNKESLQPIAYKALFNLGAGATSVVPTLAEQLTQAQDARKLELVKLLQHIGATAGAALPQLQECMKSSNPAIRKAALNAILVINPSEKEKQEILSKTITDEDETVKTDAIQALAASTANSPETLKALTSSAERGTVEQKISSMKTLGNYGAVAISSLPILIKTYVSTTVSPPIRKVAFETIKKLDPTGNHTIPLVRDNLNDPFKSRASIELLEYIGSPVCAKLVAENKARWHMGQTIK